MFCLVYGSEMGRFSTQKSEILVQRYKKGEGVAQKVYKIDRMGGKIEGVRKKNG
jgi:hypothetical protein